MSRIPSVPPPRAFSFVPDWNHVRARAASHARDHLAILDADFSWWQPRLSIPGPEIPSGWAHHYFCGDDGTRLRFDPGEPRRHVCPHCDRSYTGEPWDNAWIMIMHSAVAGQLERASVLSRLADEPRASEARAELQRIVVHYATRYPDYAPHGSVSGKGRVQPQSLDEAIWAITLFRSLRWSDPTALPASLRMNIDSLARSVVELLRPQIGMIHNIHCWLLAAVAECAMWLGDEALLEWTGRHEFGVESQILRGFHPEGLWYEINPHYHYYTLSALLSWREAAGPDSLSNEAVRRLVLAVNQPPRLAYADGRLPAYADGWPFCHLSRFAPIVEMARALLPGACIDIAPYYRHERPCPLRLRCDGEVPPTESPSLSHRASVAALLFGENDLPPDPGSLGHSFLWPQTGLGLLRDRRVRIALRYGPDGGGHDHRDKLNVDIETSSGWQSLDLGTSGYGSAFTEWMRSPAAHNLVILDGQRQPEHTGRLLAWSDTHLAAESAWDGVRLQRSLQLSEGGWGDTVTVELSSPRRIDWCFHGDGVFTADSGETEPATLVGEGGFSWLKNVRRLSTTKGLLCGAWQVKQGPAVALSLPVPAGFEVYLAEGDGNPNNRPLGFVIFRGIAAQAVFNATFTPINAFSPVNSEHPPAIEPTSQ